MNKENVLTASYSYVECLQNWFIHRAGKTQQEFQAFATRNGVDIVAYSEARRVPLDVLARLWSTAEKDFSRPQIALEAATCRPPGNFGIPEFMLLYSRTMADGLSYLRDYSRLIHDSAVMNFEFNLNQSVIEVSFLNGYHSFNRYATELFFSLVYENAGRFLVGRPFNISGVGVENASLEQLRVYQDFFKAPAFVANKGFVIQFAEDLREAKMIGHNPDVLPTFERSARTEMALLPNPMNLVDKVIQELLSQMQSGGDFYINSVAKSLGSTVRSLQRHLQNYGTEYSAVLDFFRKENSQYLLQQGQHSVKEIASMLGFKNLASFYRAYKRWYGRAPKSGAAVARSGMGSPLLQEVSARGTFVTSEKMLPKPTKDNTPAA